MSNIDPNYTVNDTLTATIEALGQLEPGLKAYAWQEGSTILVKIRLSPTVNLQGKPRGKKGIIVRVPMDRLEHIAEGETYPSANLIPLREENYGQGLEEAIALQAEEINLLWQAINEVTEAVGPEMSEGVKAIVEGHMNDFYKERNK